MPLYADNSKEILRGLLKLSNNNLVALSYQKLSVTGTAVSLTVPDTARYALITVESSITTPAIRYLELGDTSLPTATNGLPKSTLDTFDVAGYQNLINFRAIQVGAGTHTLHIQYYK